MWDEHTESTGCRARRGDLTQKAGELYKVNYSLNRRDYSAKDEGIYPADCLHCVPKILYEESGDHVKTHKVNF